MKIGHDITIQTVTNSDEIDRFEVGVRIQPIWILKKKISGLDAQQLLSQAMAPLKSISER